MEKKTRILGIFTLFVTIAILYFVFLILGIDSFPFYLIFTISSVAILSTGTIYTIVQSKPPLIPPQKKKKYIPPKKSNIRESDFLEDYFEANPLVDGYANAIESYEDIKGIEDYIFSVFNQEDLAKLDMLDLSKMDKIFFLREMLYFEPEERKNIINNMLKNKDKTDEELLTYNPPLKTINIDDKVRVYVRSLVEPGEKTKIIIIETDEFVNIIKERIGTLFDYDLNTFLLSTGGILLQENMKIRDYSIDDDDEIALIPSRKPSD
jgi:hypothetical protein